MATDSTIDGDGTTSDPLTVVSSGGFDRDNILAGTNIVVTNVGTDNVRIAASGSISAVDQVARDAAAAAQSTADGAVTVNTTQQSELDAINSFTNADESKLDGIETGAEVNVGVEFTNADNTKLDGIETGARCQYRC